MEVMKNTIYNSDANSDNNIEQLQQHALDWDKLIQQSTDDIIFLKKLLSSDVFENYEVSFFDTIKIRLKDLEEFKAEKIDLHYSINNHKNDLNGMRECEDISCDMFYEEEHKKLRERVRNFLKKFRDLKLEIYDYTSPNFRKLTI